MGLRLQKYTAKLSFSRASRCRLRPQTVDLDRDSEPRYHDPSCKASCPRGLMKDCNSSTYNSELQQRSRVIQT